MSEKEKDMSDLMKYQKLILDGIIGNYSNISCERMKGTREAGFKIELNGLKIFEVWSNPETDDESFAGRIVSKDVPIEEKKKLNIIDKEKDNSIWDGRTYDCYSFYVKWDEKKTPAYQKWFRTLIDLKAEIERLIIFFNNKDLTIISPTSQLSLDNKQADDAYEEEIKADPFSAYPPDYAYENITPKPKPETEMLASDNISNSNKYKRDKTVAKNALAHAHFRCEIDPSHKTFIRRNSDIPYTESHHLIPMQYSDQFDFSLDTEVNIVSLCSNCHNQIHYGKDAESLIRKLYKDREEYLKKAGLFINEDQLVKIYSVYEESDDR